MWGIESSLRSPPPPVPLTGGGVLSPTGHYRTLPPPSLQSPALHFVSAARIAGPAATRDCGFGGDGRPSCWWSLARRRRSSGAVWEAFGCGGGRWRSVAPLRVAPPTPPPTLLRSLGESLTLSPHSLRPRKAGGAAWRKARRRTVAKPSGLWKGGLPGFGRRGRLWAKRRGRIWVARREAGEVLGWLDVRGFGCGRIWREAA